MRKINGQQVYTVDRARLAELSQALRTDTMAAYVKKYPQGHPTPPSTRGDRQHHRVVVGVRNPSA